MSDLDARRREALVEALAKHWVNGSRCDCGWRIDYGAKMWWVEQHAAHAADALAPLIAGWLAEAKAEALREVADEFDANPERKWSQGAFAFWLRDRADRIGGTP